MPNDKLYIGIDPGASGGIAYLHRGLMTAVPMPETERDLFNCIHALSPGRNATAIIEQIGPAFPKISKSSMSKLYGNYLVLRMTLIGNKIPFEAKLPRVWQRAMGIAPKKKTETKTQWKNRLKARAQELFPELKVTLPTADAILIAEYCRRLHEGQPC